MAYTNTEGEGWFLNIPIDDITNTARAKEGKSRQRIPKAFKHSRKSQAT